MSDDAEIGVHQPDSVDADALKECFPYGRPDIRITKGGLDIDKPGGGKTVIANAAVIVSFEMEAV